jgi:flagellar hook-length control protein FliK
MNQPLPPIDIPNIAPKTPQSASGKGTDGEGATSFSSVLSEEEAAVAGSGGSGTSQQAGKELPERQDSASDQPRADGQTTDPEAARTANLPAEPAAASVAAGDGETLPGQQDGQLTLQLGEATQVSSPGQSVATAETLQNELQQSAALSQQTAPSLQQAASLSQQNERLQQSEVLTQQPAALSQQHELLPEEAGLPQPAKVVASLRFPVAEATQTRTSPELVVTVVRESVQLAVASQGAANGGLQQSLQEGRTLQADPAALAAQSRTDPNTTTFAQVLSDSSSTLPSSRVLVPVGQQGWGREVGQQVVWYVSQNISAANLRLNPQHLGPMELQVTMDGDQANVAFVSQHAVVREALESAIPRLREMLAENGLNLANVNVSQHDASGQHDRAASDAGPAGEDAGLASGGNDADSDAMPDTGVALGLVDYYV